MTVGMIGRRISSITLRRTQKSELFWLTPRLRTLICSLRSLDESLIRSGSYQNKKSRFTRFLILVRAERIELSSHAWKARILAIIRRPQASTRPL